MHRVIVLWLVGNIEDAVSTADYMISWTVGAPMDAYKAGAEYSRLAGLVASFVGVPFIIVRIFIGPLVVGLKWYWNTR